MGMLEPSRSPVEVTVELPFTVVFEPPSRAELRALLALRRVWVAAALATLAVGTAVVLAELVRTDALASGPLVTLRVASRPAGASVWLDDRARGVTPLELAVPAGPHHLTLTASEALDSQLALQVGEAGAALDVPLLRRQPLLRHVRPTLPGAGLADVRLLANGQLALTVGVRPGALGAWRLDPATGALEPLLVQVSATRLVLAPDGRHMAVLGPEIGPPSVSVAAAADEAGVPAPSVVVWLLQAPFDQPAGGWRPPPGEVPLDARWSPAADGLLVVTGPASSGASPLNHLWWLEAASAQAHELQALPSQVVPGSETWSPDGQHVTFVAHAGRLNALCVLGLADGSFRYLADLEPSDAPPLAYPAVGWSDDSQSVLFTAPRDQPASAPIGGWFTARPGNGLFVARATDGLPTLVRELDVGLPGWQADGRVLGLGRPDTSGPLALELVDGSSGLQRLLELPFRPHRGYAAAWNAGHTRAIIADPTPEGSVDYWVALLGLEDAP